MIVAGVTADYGLGLGIAKLLGARYCRFYSKIFSDGESYLRLDEKVKGEDILLVQSMDMLQDKRFTEMLLAVDAAIEAHANEIYGLVPYLAYARQDRVFLEGEPVSSRAILNALSSAGMSKLAVIEPHKKEELSYFKGKSLAIEVIYSIASEAAKKTSADTLVAPDSGAMPRVSAIAEKLGMDWDYIEKKRSREDGSLSIARGLSDMANSKVLIVDDMISTGGTIVMAAKEALSKGASRVDAAASHLILANGAYGRIKDAGVGNIYGSNCTSNNSCEIIDVSGAVAEALSGFLVD